MSSSLNEKMSDIYSMLKSIVANAKFQTSLEESLTAFYRSDIKDKVLSYVRAESNMIIQSEGSIWF